MIDWRLPRTLARRRDVLFGAGAAALVGAGEGWGEAEAAGNPIARFIANAILPKAPPYPATDPALVTAEARRLSGALLAHVAAFLDGRAPAAIPPAAIPKGTAPEERANLRVARVEDVTPEDYWVIRPAVERLDFRALRGLFPDPHCTYMVPGVFLVPFGCRVEIEGEFPHARFFSLQVTPPFDPLNYYYGGAFGVPEVPIVDVDIDPLPGHTNPFRTGADRDAARRGWRVEWDMREGDGPAIEPAYRPPHYRRAGNRRTGGGLAYQGPFGRPGILGGHGRGEWAPGALWLRYYAPDRDAGPLAGVALPRVSYRLPDGRRFLILSDAQAKDTAVNRTFPAPVTKPVEADPELQGREVGWGRATDIFADGLAAVFQAVGKTSAKDKAQGRALVRGLVGRGEELGAPRDYASSTSRSDHITYLNRGMNLGADRVIVLTGRLPSFPRTRDGAGRMGRGQVRYLSFTTYPTPDFLKPANIGIPQSSIMDEDIVVDAEGRYVICYSRGRERPINARAGAGVTWVDWGPSAAAGWTIRWLTVSPDTKDGSITPDEAHISYAQANWFSEGFDPTLVGINGRSPIMRDYLPRVHSLRRATFEALGPRVRAADVPDWE